MWPFQQPESPSENQLKEHQQKVNELAGALYRSNKAAQELVNDKTNLAQAYIEYATLLRDAKQFEHALHQCRNAFELWNELKNEDQKLTSDILRISILAQSGQKDLAIRSVEDIFQQIVDDHRFAATLETLLIHRAGLLYIFGQTSLATKDLDHALMLRENRTGVRDIQILEFRHTLLLMDEAAAAEAEKQKPTEKNA